MTKENQSAPVDAIVRTPWEAERQCAAIVIVDGDGRLLCEFWRRGHDAREFASAQLAAAAPDLLAACQAFVATDNQCGANIAFAMAQQAIAKAGVSPKANGGETCDKKHGPCSCGATH